MIHSFTAQCATTSGSTVVWGNITPIRINGYPLTAFAATTKDGQWRAATKITFANGDEAVVWQSSGSGGAPDMLSPFISYPAGDAVKMTIYSESSRWKSREMCVTTDSLARRHICLLSSSHSYAVCYQR